MCDLFRICPIYFINLQSKCPHSLMDRIKDSGSFGRGSNPLGGTGQRLSTSERLFFFIIGVKVRGYFLCIDSSDLLSVYRDIWFTRLTLSCANSQIYIRVSNHGGKNKEFAHVTMSIKHDGGRKGSSAHVVWNLRALSASTCHT